MWNASRRPWRDLALELFDRDGLDTVFSHARNVLTGAAIIAAGRSPLDPHGRVLRAGAA